MWLDNLYLRASYHNADRPHPKFRAMSLSGFAPLEWPLQGQGKTWITRITFQGDGVGSAVGVWAGENMYIESTSHSSHPTHTESTDSISRYDMMLGAMLDVGW